MDPMVMSMVAQEAMKLKQKLPTPKNILGAAAKNAGALSIVAGSMSPWAKEHKSLLAADTARLRSGQLGTSEAEKLNDLTRGQKAIEAQTASEADAIRRGGLAGSLQAGSVSEQAKALQAARAEGAANVAASIADTSQQKAQAEAARIRTDLERQRNYTDQQLEKIGDKVQRTAESKADQANKGADMDAVMAMLKLQGGAA